MYPRLFRIGPVTVPTFGVVAALGLVAAILLAARGARSMRISEDSVWTLCMVMAGGTLVLSRLIIIAQVPRSFLHYPLYILTLPSVTRYGLLAALGSGLAYILVKRMPLLRTADALGPALLLFQAFLHLGSLFAGDDLGSPTHGWMGRLVRGDTGYHPVALYSALLSALAALAASAWLHRETRPGQTFGLTLALAAGIRFFIDQLRPDYVLPEALLGFLRVDQVILIGLTVVGLGFFLQRKPRDAQ